MRWSTGIVVILLVLAGCSQESAPNLTVGQSSVFAPCPEPSSSEPAPASIPHLSLGCMDGSGTMHDVSLPVGMPRVITLWASWCPPCYDELPMLGRVASLNESSLAFLGVNTEDTASHATRAAQENGVSFPQVFDPKGSLRRALSQQSLPVTLFVDSSGNLVHVFNEGVLTKQNLAKFAEQYLGLVVRV